MNDRRKALEKIALGMAAVPAAAALLATADKAKAVGFEAQQMCRPPGDPGEALVPVALSIPDVPVIAHDGTRGLLYSQFMKDRIVLVNVVDTRSTVSDKAMANLAAIQQALGNRLGKDVLMFSLTADPRHDTQTNLADYAAKFGVGPYWKLLTGHPDDIQAAQYRFFGPHGIHGHARGMVRYGNVKVGLWGGFAADLKPHLALRRVDWVTAAAPPAKGVYQRRGPAAQAWKRPVYDARRILKGEA